MSENKGLIEKLESIKPTGNLNVIQNCICDCMDVSIRETQKTRDDILGELRGYIGTFEDGVQLVHHDEVVKLIIKHFGDQNE